MTESILILSLVGFMAGFILSMPVAGPISILITSNALKGRIRYCHRATIGASLADFVFIFIAVYGVTKLYTLYKPFIPYVLLAGALFLFYVGLKILKTKIDLEHPHDDKLAAKIKSRGKGGFLTGFLISFLNPTLFISWMTSSLIILSFVASFGFNMGGLDKNLNETFREINKIEGTANQGARPSFLLRLNNKNTSAKEEAEGASVKTPKYFPLILSLSYAVFVSLGSIIWFYFLAWLLVKFRDRINKVFIRRLVQGLALVLCLFGLFIGYKGLILIMH